MPSSSSSWCRRCRWVSSRQGSSYPLPALSVFTSRSTPPLVDTLTGHSPLIESLSPPIADFDLLPSTHAGPFPRLRLLSRVPAQRSRRDALSPPPFCSLCPHFSASLTNRRRGAGSSCAVDPPHPNRFPHSPSLLLPLSHSPTRALLHPLAPIAPRTVLQSVHTLRLHTQWKGIDKPSEKQA